MKGKQIELPKEIYVEFNDNLEKYDHSPITEMQRVVEKIMIERAQKVDSVILGEIQQIAVENGIETKIILNEQNVAEALRNYQDGYAHIKAEVAREIIEDVATLIEEHWSEIQHGVYWLVCGRCTPLRELLKTVEKKYTERSVELKPCPYCGKSVARIVNCYENNCREDTSDCAGEYCHTVAVCCDFYKGGCGATGGYRKTEEEAIGAWNRRADK